MVGDKLAELVVITYHVSELDMQMAVQTLKGLPVIKKYAASSMLKMTTWSDVMKKA
mgnify:CR=1 FL=1